MPVSSGSSTSSTGTDVFVALDQGDYFDRFLLGYSGNLYQFISTYDIITFTPTVVKGWKSIDGGATWSAVASTFTIPNAFSPSISPLLIGAKLYFWHYAAGGLTAVHYFDFATDTFALVATSNNPNNRASGLLAGLSADLMFTAHETGVIAQSVVLGVYTASTFSTLTTLVPVNPYKHSQPQAMIQGTSGVVHVLYQATKQAGTVGPSDLGYVEIVGGTVSGSIGSNIIFTNYSDSFLQPDTGMGIGPMLQIGGMILASFYDPFNQKLKLLSFPDVSNPTFSISDIDASWAITVGGPSDEPGTGSWSNVLAYYNGKLYCFYVNTWVSPLGVYSGDGTLYFRSSPDAGATWSARTAIITHKDPLDAIPFVIWYPEAVQFVGSLPSPVKSVALGYSQAKANSGGQYGYNGRFVTNLKLSAPLNYVRD